MEKYKAPEIIIMNFTLKDTVATIFTEGDDNETGWLDKWTSGIING